MANSNAGRSVPLAEAPLYRETECEPWGFWASLLWSGFALGLFYGFDSFEHTLLRGTAFGRLIGESFALGALNSLVEWSNPLVILLVAIRIRGCPVLDYFAWIRPRAGDVVLGIVLAVVLQVLSYGVPYLLVGADITANAIAQYRAEAAAGTPHWVPVLLSWPGILAAPFVEESVFRGFMWRGWESRLGALATWLLITLVFTAWHIPKATGLDPFNAGLMVVEVFLFGLFLGWLRRRSGTTTAPIVAHITLNVIPPLYPVLVGAIFAGHLFGG